MLPPLTAHPALVKPRLPQQANRRLAAVFSVAYSAGSSLGAAPVGLLGGGPVKEGPSPSPGWGLPVAAALSC